MQFPQGHKKVENSQPGLAPTSRGPHTPEAPRPRGASWENPGRAARTRGGRTPDSAPALRSGTRRPPAEGRGREAPGPPRGLADDGNRPDCSPRPQPSGQGRLSARPGSCPPRPGSRPLPGFPGGFRAVAEARWPDGISEPRDPSARPPRAPPRVLRPPARPGSGASPHFRRPATCARGGSGAPPAGSSRYPRPRFPQKRKAGPAVLGPDRVPP